MYSFRTYGRDDGDGADPQSSRRHSGILAYDGARAGRLKCRGVAPRVRVQRQRAPTKQQSPPTAASLLVWRDSLANSSARPALDSTAAYFLSLTHRVSAVSKQNGAPIWSVTLPVSTPNRNGYGVVLAGGRLVVGDIDLFGLDPPRAPSRVNTFPRPDDAQAFNDR